MALTRRFIPTSFTSLHMWSYANSGYVDAIAGGGYLYYRNTSSEMAPHIEFGFQNVNPGLSVFESVKIYGSYHCVEEGGGEQPNMMIIGASPYDIRPGISISKDETKSISHTYTTNPSTGLPWTKDEVNAITLYIGGVVRAKWSSNYPELWAFNGYIEVTFEAVKPFVTTLDAESITNSSASLKGNITDDGGLVTERGFKYYKDGEPEEVKTLKEEGSFGEGEYSLTAGGLEAGTKYYFRAYVLNEIDVDYGGWKNFTTTALPPIVSTQGVTDIKIDNAVGHGIIEDTGGQPGVYKCIVRGFEVKIEYSGSLGDFAFVHAAGFIGSVHFDMDDGNFKGTLIKTISEGGYFDAGEYELLLARTPHTVFSDKLFAGETYSYRAFAINEDDLIGYGSWVGFTTLEVIIETPGAPPDGGHIDGVTTEIKNITVQNLGEGEYATRIGIRYGTTPSANEFDIHIDGIFSNGTYKFVLTDLIPDTKYYQVPYILAGNGGGGGEEEPTGGGEEEGPPIEGETLPEEPGEGEPEDEFPEDEFPTPYYGPHGQDYREVVKKVFAEKLSTQPIIDFSGGKKTLKLNNHLIQTRSNALVIASNYLGRFQFAKTKLMVEYPTPMPFEREDTIDFDYGKILFKSDGDGVVPFRADGQGQINTLNMVSMIIRKINLKMGISERTIEYLATLELEEE